MEQTPSVSTDRLFEILRATGKKYDLDKIQAAFTYADALHAGNNICNIHTFHQSCNALQVTVAATNELHVLNLSFLHIEEDALGAGAFGLVFVLHNP